MTKRKNMKPMTQDQMIKAARSNRAAILERLQAISFEGPPSHVTIAASKLLLEIGERKTETERNPFNFSLL